MFTINELATAAEERIALPVIVWNNDALMAIVEQMDQRQIRASRRAQEPRLHQSGGGPRLSWRSRRQRRTSSAVRARCIAADRPTLIEVRQDSPWLMA